jgi:hypothetical protein
MTETDHKQKILAARQKFGRMLRTDLPIFRVTPKSQLLREIEARQDAEIAKLEKLNGR